MKSAIAACAGAALLAVTGCSSLEGETYTYGKADEDGKLKGVPFTLNKPAPTIVHTPATDDKRETYTMTFAYTADSSHRYVLTANPPTLASVDFSMSFDALGSLSEGSAKTTDQSAAIITSVGKLAIAAAAFDSSGQAVDADVARLIEKGDAMKFTGEERVNWESVKADLQRLQTDKKVKAEYVYRLPGERAVLRKIHAKSMAELVAHADALRDDTPPIATSPTVNPAPVPRPEDADPRNFRSTVNQVKKMDDQPLAAAILRAMKAGDLTSLSSMRSAELATLQAQRVTLELNGSTTGLKATRDTIARISVLDTAAKAIPNYLKLTQSLAELSPTDWKRRTVAALNTDIDAVAHTVRLQLANSALPLSSLGTLECPVTSQDSEADAGKGAAGSKKPAAAQKSSAPPELRALCRLKQKKAIVLGVGAEYRRRTQLAATLATERAPKQLKLLRDEIAALDTAISDAESALKPKAKELKAEEPYAAFYRNVTSDMEETADSVLSFVGNKRPKYVILVRSLETGDHSRTPPPDIDVSKQGDGSGGKGQPKVGVPAPPETPKVPPVTGGK